MYFELKFRVDRDDLERVRVILLEQFRGSDPYPDGLVDTVYFDTEELGVYALCARDDPRRIKFRARGYRDDELSELQIKAKRGGALHKIKTPLRTPAAAASCASWDELAATLDEGEARGSLEAHAAPWGPLRPCLRVRYARARFRVLDQRVTLDSGLRFDAFGGVFTSRLASALVDDGVLEIKSPRPDVHLPLLGLVRLAPRSLTKFREGIEALEVNGEGSEGGDLW